MVAVKIVFGVWSRRPSVFDIVFILTLKILFYGVKLFCCVCSIYLVICLQSSLAGHSVLFVKRSVI